jgi:amino acid transporter
LVADYIVTASLSCYDAFLYLGFTFEDAKRWSIVTIFIIGSINFFGPRQSGGIAVVLGLLTVTVLGLLALASLPHLPTAIAHLESPHSDPLHWWGSFVGVILALSGVEAIANTTGLMQLDPGSTPAKPRVATTSRKAIIPVMFEVCLLTALFGLAMNAIPGMNANDHVGDMLRFLAVKFVDEPLQLFSGLAWIGVSGLFSSVVGLVIALLLLSAVNTAIVDLVSVLYLMSKDGEMPQPFSVLNKFGVPWILLLIAMLAPILVIDIQSGENALHGLAEMYAIGVVGAITVNLGSSAFNYKLPMLRHERTVMTVSFLILAAVEVSIAITKPPALLFAVTVVGLGFAARAMHKGIGIPPRLKSLIEQYFPGIAASLHAKSLADIQRANLITQLRGAHPIAAVMVAAREVVSTLQFAVNEARLNNAKLYVLFVRSVFTRIPVAHNPEEDLAAQAVFGALKSIADGVEVIPIYAVSDDPGWAILDHAATSGVDMLILGHSRRYAVTRLLRGDVIQKVAANLPEEIRLVIVG